MLLHFVNLKEATQLNAWLNDAHRVVWKWFYTLCRGKLSVRSSRGKMITLFEARNLALKILADTESRLDAERVTDAWFHSDVWDDEDHDTP